MTGIYKAYFTSSPLQRRVRPSPPIGKPIHLLEGTGMQLFVKGIKGETLTLNVRSTSLIEDIKATIEEKSGDPQDSQRLIWRGRHLEDGRTLAFYKIGREETFHLVLRLAGC
ncbi:ubiquitin-related domain-containing protein [Leptodontidium sp. 2 PMI_412]|nr:ubiquitin-related domain-containing protein [Leptodontidium sp. 2 PMI_412]